MCMARANTRYSDGRRFGFGSELTILLNMLEAAVSRVEPPV